MKKVITFGEIMLRLSTPGFARFVQANRFNAVYAGSEANVAVSLAKFNVPSAHVTRFPHNDLGTAAVEQLRKHGVTTDYIVFGKERMGVYFIENGSMQRSSRIIYDRFDSAFAHLQPGEINWDAIMKEASWFHWSGITPAISAGAAQSTLEALHAAEKHGVVVSGDINYRRNLWQYGKTARDIMPALVEKTDFIVGAIADFENCLGISGTQYGEACGNVSKQYRRAKQFSMTFRESVSASHNKISGVLWGEGKLYQSKEYDLTHIVDRIGAGDAFMAGLIHASLHGKKPGEMIEFATAACALKHSVEGDVNEVSAQEVEDVMKGENVGKLLR